MTLHPALARLERGFRRMWAWVRARVTGRRDHRFEGEQANLADQLAQTQTSLGLLAAAAQHRDDEHRLQALHTEQMLRDRKRVLEKHRRKRGLADEERWELESINRGLDDLTSPARPDTHGEQLLADFEPDLVRRTDGGWKPQGFAGLAAVSLVRPWMLWTAALAAVAMWGGYNDIRAGRAENQRDEAERAARSNAAAAESWRERANEYRLAVIDAAEVARLAAADLERERAARARAQQRERIRQREIQDVLSGSDDAPAWRLRDDPAPDDQSSPN